MTKNNATSRPTVLLAHYDEEILRQLEAASDICDKYDYHSAVSGQEVIDLINKHYFDVVIIGSRFADITGTGMAELVKSKFPYIKGVFLSSHNHGLFKYRADLLGFKIWNKSRSLNNLQTLCQEIVVLLEDCPPLGSIKESSKQVKLPEVLRQSYSGIF